MSVNKLNLKKVLLISSAILLFGTQIAFSAKTLPTVEGAWVHLHQAPKFLSPSMKLAEVWGPSIPMGNQFIVENSYGRWLYGKLVPLQYMAKKDHAQAGWVYSRSLVPPNDIPSRSLKERKEIFYTSYYYQQFLQKAHLSPKANSFFYLDFMDSLVLSKRTILQFRHQDKRTARKLYFFPGIQAAQAEVKGKLEFSGANLSFLRNESHFLAKKRKKKHREYVAKLPKPPQIPAANNNVKENILGRYIAAKKFQIPNLTHDEVDAHIYLRALTYRVLKSCPAKIKEYWKNKHWSQIRTKNFAKNSGELWFQFELPGGLFLNSDQAIRFAENEAELAFVLIRPMILASYRKKFSHQLDQKDWMQKIQSSYDLFWNDIQRKQSMKLSKNLDIATDISVDLAATECIANAGYFYGAGINYLQRLFSNLNQPWNSWYKSNHLGTKYRLNEFTKRVQINLANGILRRSNTTNKSRFFAALRLWNIHK